jgi:hypothetical protein
MKRGGRFGKYGEQKRRERFKWRTVAAEDAAAAKRKLKKRRRKTHQDE